LSWISSNSRTFSIAIAAWSANVRTAIFLRDGNVYRIAARYGFSPELEEYIKQHPLPLSRETLTGRVAITGGVVHIPDALADPEYTYLEGQRLGGYRAMLGVPLLRGPSRESASSGKFLCQGGWMALIYAALRCVTD
jgi:signal transduction protein with GAF and PtsI domain